MIIEFGKPSLTVGLLPRSPSLDDSRAPNVS